MHDVTKALKVTQVAERSYAIYLNGPLTEGRVQRIIPTWQILPRVPTNVVLAFFPERTVMCYWLLD